MNYDLSTIIEQTKNKIDSNYVSFLGIILSVKKSPSFENLRIVTFTDNSKANLICNIFIEEELLWETGDIIACYKLQVFILIFLIDNVFFCKITIIFKIIKIF